MASTRRRASDQLSCCAGCLGTLSTSLVGGIVGRDSGAGPLVVGVIAAGGDCLGRRCLCAALSDFLQTLVILPHFLNYATGDCGPVVAFAATLVPFGGMGESTSVRSSRLCQTRAT